MTYRLSKTAERQLTRLTAPDLDRLKPLWLQLHSHHQSVAPHLQPFVDPETSWAARRALYERSLRSGGFVFLAENDAGYLVASRENSPWPAHFVCEQEPITELVTINVDARHRGKGLGSQLLDAFDAELARQGTKDSFVGAIPANTRAIDLYRRRGFEPTSLLMMRFARQREQQQPQSRAGIAAAMISAASEVDALEDLWGSTLLEKQTAPEKSWALIYPALLRLASQGMLFQAIEENGSPLAFAALVHADAKVLSDTWLTSQNVIEITTLAATQRLSRSQRATAVHDLLDHIDTHFGAKGFTDQMINVMCHEEQIIDICKHRGFQPGWLQLQRFA